VETWYYLGARFGEGANAMAESEPVGKEIFDNLSALLRDIRFKAYEKDDKDTSSAVDRAEALLGDFAATVGDFVNVLVDENLILKKKLKYLMQEVLPPAAVALQGHYKACNELESKTTEAMVAVTSALEKLV
jgi:hypothetical protein